MKILYAANNSFGSFLQMKRILPFLNKHDVRIAGFKKYLFNISADYTLEALDALNKNKLIAKKCVRKYIDEIDSFGPDLIINDLHYYTSLAASELNIKYWIVNSTLLYKAIPKDIRSKLKINATYGHAVGNDSDYNKFQIKNAERVFVYSYLCDVPMAPIIDDPDRYEWVRPYTAPYSGPGYVRGVSGTPDHERFVVALNRTNKPLVRWFGALKDVNLYSMNDYEKYKDIQHRNLFSDKYSEDLSTALLVINRGETSLVADAFYNKKYVLIYPNYNNIDTIINSYFVSHFNIGEKIQTRNTFEQINTLESDKLKISLFINNNVKFLHEYL